MGEGGGVKRDRVIMSLCEWQLSKDHQIGSNVVGEITTCKEKIPMCGVAIHVQA